MIIYIFGPSCSGKSTLCEALQRRLGDSWTYVDRDRFIEDGLCTESAADRTLEERIQAIKTRMIVDAQIPWAEKRAGEIHCLLLPPLEVLLKRDTRRTQRFQRSERRAFYAREYVVNTHRTLAAIHREKFDACFDSSLLSVEQIVLKILQFVGKK